jgi:glycosyltransferase involved in cell wall biosynthesis
MNQAVVLPNRSDLSQSVNKNRILLIARSLEVGGAERQLVESAIALKGNGLDIIVVTLYASGGLETCLWANGIDWVSLSKSKRWENLRCIYKLARVFNSARPNVVYSFLSVPNLFSLIAAKLSWTRPKVVWGIRNSADPRDYPEFMTRLSFFIERRLARFADLILCNSSAACARFRHNPTAAKKTLFLPNGVDLLRFSMPTKARALADLARPSPAHRIIGIVGRMDPRKDHLNFLEAVARLSKENLDVIALIVGCEPSAYLTSIQHRAETLGIASQCRWLATTLDLADVYAAMDVLVSSSTTEGFQNVLVEAMSAGTPCVSTDVGSAREIIDDPSCIAEAGNSVALATCIKYALDCGKPAQHYQDRAQQHFSREALGRNLISHFDKLLNAPVTRPH